MSNSQKVYTGFAKTKELKFGKVTELSWSREQYEELGKYFTDSGYINVSLLTSASGDPYMQVNMWNVNGAGASSSNAPIATPAQEDDNALPFQCETLNK